MDAHYLDDPPPPLDPSKIKHSTNTQQVELANDIKGTSYRPPNEPDLLPKAEATSQGAVGGPAPRRNSSMKYYAVAGIIIIVVVAVAVFLLK